MAIDTSTDFRYQALRVGLKRLDAVLFTHAHADHCFGLDDTRPLMFRNGTALPCYATEVTWEGLRRVYAYAFQPAESGVPQLIPHVMDGAFQLFGLEIQPLTVLHVVMPFEPVSGFPGQAAAWIPEVDIVAEARRTLAKMVERTLRGRRGRRIECRVVLGNPVQRILDAARRADSIVMATAGRSGLAHLVIGSVAEKVVRHASVPVLTVRSPAGGRRGRRRRA